MTAHSNPLLSICIPTYNRSSFLKKSIESLMNQGNIDYSEFEVVISDNASTDDTTKVVDELMEKYVNLHYYRNERNIIDDNFPTVIERANGSYRKLMNDTAIWIDGSLGRLLDLIKRYRDQKPIISFSNAFVNGPCNYDNVSVDSFTRSISYWTTWIGSFGIWEDDIKLVSDFHNGTETQLWQVVILYELLSLKKMRVVSNEHFINNMIATRGGYNYYKIFAVNYFDIIFPCYKSGLINRKTFMKLKKDLFFDHFLKRYLLISGNTKLNKHDFNNQRLYLRKYYSLSEYFFLLFLRFIYPKKNKIVNHIDKIIRFVWRRTINRWKYRKNGVKVPVFYKDN